MPKLVTAAAVYAARGRRSRAIKRAGEAGVRRPRACIVYVREYVRPSDLLRVGRWIRRHRANEADARSLLAALKRLAAAEEDASA